MSYICELIVTFQQPESIVKCQIFGLFRAGEANLRRLGSASEAVFVDFCAC